MNRAIIYIILGLSVFLSGCFEEKNLRPFIFPDLVNNTNRLVESFPEDSVLFVATDGGLMVRFKDQQYAVFPIGSFPQVSFLNLEQIDIFFDKSTEKIVIVSDSIVMRLGRNNTLETFVDDFDFYEPTKFYFDYAMSPNGKLYRIDYYTEIWDPNSGSFDSDYFIAIHEFTGVNRALWRTVETEMSVRSNFLSSPHAAFNDNGDMLIMTNPSYIVRNLNGNSIDFEAVDRASNFRGMIDPVWNEDARMVYGFNRNPGWFEPVDGILSAAIDQESVTFSPFSATCNLDEPVIGAVKVLQWTPSNLVMYVQLFTNELTGVKSSVGYVYTYDLSGNDCMVTAIQTDEILLPFANGINDVAFLEQELYFGTESGLLIYNVQTESFEPYLRRIFEAETE